MECNFENCPNFERLGKKFADRISELEQENDRLKEEVRTEKIYSSQIEELEESLNHLKQENERLKEEIKEVKKYQYQQEYLDKEIEEMQKALKTLAEGLNKRQMLLQEIKAIVSGDYEMLDPQTLQEIRSIITKTEEE